MTVPDDIRARLITCFAAVFPKVSDNDELARLSVASWPDWDSLSTITLVAVVEEEFAIAFSVEDLEILSSFELVLSLVMDRSKIEND